MLLLNIVLEISVVRNLGPLARHFHIGVLGIKDFLKGRITGCTCRQQFLVDLLHCSNDFRREGADFDLRILLLD